MGNPVVDALLAERAVGQFLALLAVVIVAGLVAVFWPAVKRVLPGLRGLLKALAVLLVAVALLFAFLNAVRANAEPAPLGDPCSIGPCKVTGAAIGVKIPLPLGSAKPKLTVAPIDTPPRPAPGHFAGKFELVPLFDKGKPVQSNGHSYYGLARSISFTTAEGDTLTAFAGSRTDLASIPAYLWATMPPDGPWAEAAVIHDQLFRTTGTMVWYGHVGRTRAAPYTRAEANDILRQAMVTLGVPAWQRITIYEGVQAGKFLAPHAWGT